MERAGAVTGAPADAARSAAPAVVDGEHFEALLKDLDAALRELLDAAGPTPQLWSRGKPGKWTAGQHVDHVAVTMEISADALEERAPMLRAGTLRARPRRGPLQSLWIRLVVKSGKLPRGGRAPVKFLPAASPEPAATLEKVRRLFERHRAVGETLGAEDRERLWIRNPFLPRWQYTLPEVIRVHAVHARHHARSVREIGGGA